MWKEIDLDSQEHYIYFDASEDDDGNPSILIDLALREGSARLVLKKRKGSEGERKVAYKKLTPSERERLGYGLTISAPNLPNRSRETASELLNSLHLQAREMVRTISELHKCDGMSESDDIKKVRAYLQKSRETISSIRFADRINTARETMQLDTNQESQSGSSN